LPEEDMPVEPISQDDVIQILRMIEESCIDELHLEMGDLKLTIRKGGKTPSVQEVRYSRKDPNDVPVLETAAAPAKTQRLDMEIPTQPEENDYLIEEGLVPIKAPMLGTFYRAPKPGALPFVEVGQSITEDDTVCIIEVMKLFNTVKAGIRGQIMKIYPKDGEMVEYHQPLFLIKKSADEKELMKIGA
jgi:acetyl-CoA carboxylase biotin carboxyl carrier protein